MPRAELDTSGKIQNIHYGDILVKYGDVVDVPNVEIPYVKDDKKIKNPCFLRNGDIIIADTAEDEMVGKAIEITGIVDEKVVSGLHTIPCRPTTQFASGYLGHYLNSSAYHNQIISLMQGIKVYSISKTNIAKTQIKYPNISIQKKIAVLLDYIEKRILLQQALINAVKSYKRGAIAHYFTTQIRSAKWTKTTISKCLFYEQPQKYIVHSEHYSNAYTTPVLTANKTFILGYTNEQDGIYNKGEVLIYDDFTMEVKYVNFPFKVKSSTIKMLTPQNNIDLYFMYSLLQFLGLKPEGHQRSYISILEPMEIQVPIYEEQVHVAKLFRLLDSKIEKGQVLLQKMIAIKSSLLQQLFI